MKHLLLNKVAPPVTKHVVESQGRCKADHKVSAQVGFKPKLQAEASSSFSWCGLEGLSAG